MIELRHLNKTYEMATPLKDVNAVIEKGDVIAVIGPSGTGKSTLLRCINRLEEPTSGQVIVDGEDITDPKCDINLVRRKLGMVFQGFNLYEHLTVVENCMLAQTTLLKRSRQEAYDKSMELLEQVGMAPKALQYPSQLSGGQKQRVAIARTLATEPEIILFDEPTSALDPLSVGEVENVIANLAHQGVTMMVVTHGMDFARKVANRVFYMDQGGIYEDGTPEQIFENPVKERTRVFIRRLACLEMDITRSNHNLPEESGKILAFCNARGIEASRIMSACAVYEEFCSFIFSLEENDEDVMNLTVEYDEANDKLTMSYTLMNDHRDKNYSEVFMQSIEYKIVSHKIKGHRIEQSDKGIGIRLTVEI